MVEEGGTMNVRQQLEARRRRREEEVHRAEFVTRWRPDTTFGYKSFSSDRNHPGAPRRQPRLYKRRSSRDIVLYHDGQLYQHQSPPHSFRSFNTPRPPMSLMDTMDKPPTSAPTISQHHNPSILRLPAFSPQASRPTSVPFIIAMEEQHQIEVRRLVCWVMSEGMLETMVEEGMLEEVDEEAVVMEVNQNMEINKQPHTLETMDEESDMEEGEAVVVDLVK